MLRYYRAGSSEWIRFAIKRRRCFQNAEKIALRNDWIFTCRYMVEHSNKETYIALTVKAGKCCLDLSTQFLTHEMSTYNYCEIFFDEVESPFRNQQNLLMNLNLGRYHAVSDELKCLCLLDKSSIMQVHNHRQQQRCLLVCRHFFLQSPQPLWKHLIAL